MRLLLLPVFSAVLFGTTPPADTAAVKKNPPTIVFPAGPDVPVKPPPPPPAADPAAPIALAKSQFYVVASAKPLLILTDGPGEVSVTPRRPPFMLPVAAAPGWPADKLDPEFVSWGPEYPYLYVVKAVKAGEVRLTLFPAVNDLDKDGKQIPLTPADAARKTLAVDGVGPAPTPKVDPAPNPTPKVDPLPIQVTGLRVIMLYDKDNKDAPLSKEQLNIATSTKIAAYLNAKCAKGDDGRPEWRKWDASTVAKAGALDKESATMKALYDHAKTKLGPLPQIVIAVNQDAVPLPWEPTEDAMLALLRRYGGN